MFQKSSSEVSVWFNLGRSDRNHTVVSEVVDFCRCRWVATAMMNERPECLSGSARHSGAVSGDDAVLSAGLSAVLRSEFWSAWVRAQ